MIQMGTGCMVHQDSWTGSILGEDKGLILLSLVQRVQGEIQDFRDIDGSRSLADRLSRS